MRVLGSSLGALVGVGWLMWWDDGKGLSIRMGWLVIVQRESGLGVSVVVHKCGRLIACPTAYSQERSK